MGLFLMGLFPVCLFGFGLLLFCLSPPITRVLDSNLIPVFEDEPQVKIP